MEVDFDNMRRQMAGAFNNVTRKWNASQLNEDDLNELGSLIGGLLCIYDEDGFMSDLSYSVEIEWAE